VPGLLDAFLGPRRISQELNYFVGMTPDYVDDTLLFLTDECS